MVLCGMWVVFSYIVFTCILKVVSFNPIHSSHTHTTIFMITLAHSTPSPQQICLSIATDHPKV